MDRIEELVRNAKAGDISDALRARLLKALR